MWRLWRALPPLALAALLAACATTPAPSPPAAYEAPPQFKEDAIWKRAQAAQGAQGAQGAQAAQSAPQAIGTDWWRVFGDPVLDDLERRLVIGNNNLRSALAQVASARAALDAAQAARWPTLSVSASRTASKLQSLANPLTVQAQAAWEVDLWGRLAGAAQVAGVSLQASQDDLAAARLSAQATLVQSYFTLRMAEAQQALLERSQAGYARSLALTQARQGAGVAALADVLQARTQLESVQAQIAEQRAQRAQAEHAIAVLLGEAPARLTIERTAALPALPQVPPLLPSTLLERRPDIAAAERRVAAAYAQIGVADAAYFPQISLTAGAGLAGSSLAGLVSAPTTAWTLGASVVGAILDSGQRRLASAQARAAAEQAGASYRQTVITALQEVEDSLVLVDQLGSELSMQRRALDAAQRNLDIVQEQYRAGTVSYLAVTTAQTAALSAEASVISAQARQLTAAGVLLKNIGGRWQDS